jgi:hypothetical protein
MVKIAVAFGTVVPFVVEVVESCGTDRDFAASRATLNQKPNFVNDQ